MSSATTASQPSLETGGRQWRRRARTRGKLVEAATVLMTERGIDAVRMSDVTTAADLGAGTIYNYFPTHEHLVDAVIHDALDVFGGRLDALSAGIADPAEGYALSLRFLVAHALNHPLWGRFLVRVGVTAPMEVLGPRARRDILRGIDSGRFDVADIDIAVACTLGSFIAVLHAVVDAPDSDDPGATFAAAMLRMVGLDPASAREVATRPLPTLAEP